MVKEIMFYTRKSCPLCDEAKRMLGLLQEDFSLSITEVDIESDVEIHEKYMLMIPVITYKNKILQYGNVDYATLYEALDENV